jgi:hypothetical protein
MKIIFLMAFFGLLSCANCQEKELDLSKALEDITSYCDESIDLESLSETIVSLHNRPLDLNKADNSDLQCIPFLSEEEIIRIISFRDEYGIFLSRYELFLIEGLDSSKAELILPFIQITNKLNDRDTLSLLRNVINTARKSVMLRYQRILQDQKGFENRKNHFSIDQNQYFVGSADYVYGRLEIHQPNDFDIGMTFEKDAGEAVFLDPGSGFYGFDHYAGYFRIVNRGILRELTIGDFQMHLGEGLVWGRGFVSKGSETIGAVRNRHSGTHPYQGASESGFLRGISVTLGDRVFNCTGFLSRKRIDAVVLSDTMPSPNQQPYVTSISSTGYHRTPDEILKRRNLKEYTSGLNAQILMPSLNLTIGATMAYTYWDLPLRKKTNYYNQFDFSGNVNYCGSVYYNLYRGKWNVFGEIAQSASKGCGFVQGVIANLVSNVETTIHVRYYSSKYFSNYGRSFAEYQGNSNEKGLYWGIKVMPIPQFEIRGYFDTFRSDWLRYHVATPATGNECFMNLRFLPDPSISLTFIFKRESKYRNDSNSLLPVQSVLEGIKENYQLSFELYTPKHFRFKTRMQGSTFKFRRTQTYGYCFAQDISYDTNNLKITSRFAYFFTEDYYNRQYMYEHDMLYTYNFPAYNGHGLRAYVLFRYSPVHNIDVWLKAAHHHFLNEDEIGTGLLSISGNKKTEIKCQVRIKF